MRNLSNNWKLTIRSLLKQKRATAINILGLAMAFAAVLFLSVYVYREFSFDNFHTKADRIFKPEIEILEADADIDMASHLSLPQIELFRDGVSGIESIAFLNYSRWDWDNGAWVEYDGNKFNLDRLAFSDSNFAEVFSFSVESGNLASALDDPNSLVLTKDISDKIFKGENPIGKEVLLNNKPVLVGAILDEIPQNSSIQISGLVSYRSAKYFFGSDIDDYSFIPFIQVATNEDPLHVGSVMSEVLRNSLPKEELEKINPVFNTKLIALEDLYFYNESPYDPIKHGSKTLTFMLLGIGILILSLAIINYTNLLMASSLKWKKDFGIQQVLGAGKKAESSQLFLKGFVISGMAFLFSILIIKIAMPWLNQLINYPIQTDIFFTSESIFIVLFLLVFTISLSGLFPSIFNFRSTTLSQLKGTSSEENQRGGIWKSLVTFQLIVSISLIISSIVIYKQINYGLKKDLGIQVENMITIPSWKLGGKKSAFINSVSDHNQTESTCLSTAYINTFNIWGGKLNEPGKAEKSVVYNIVRVNDEFVETLGLELVKGRDFKKNSANDEKSIIVNEAFLKFHDVSNPLESTIRGLPIIGVVNDFNFNSIHHQIEPMVLWNTPKNAGLSTIRFTADTREGVREYMAFLKKEWTKLEPEKPFEFEFLDNRLAAMYRKDVVLSKALISFALLAIFIACLGILGLLSHIMESRIKEIGIRKVNGAGVLEILKLINIDLIKWITIGFVIACPIAWYAMNKWLENFAYKTTLSWWVFALAGMLALGIALLTVSWQSWRAATRNPVEALRYE